MADTVTTNLELIRPENRTAGWGTKVSTNMDSLDRYLATVIAAGEDPNVTKLPGYKNMIVLDNTVPLPTGWICTVTDISTQPAAAVEWELLSDILIQNILDGRNVWGAAQVNSWVTPVADPGSPPFLTITEDHSFINYVLGTDVEVRLPSITLSEAQFLFFRMVQGVSEFAITWNGTVLWPGDVVPPNPVIGQLATYSLIHQPTSDSWIGTYNLGFV